MRNRNITTAEEKMRAYQFTKRRILVKVRCKKDVTAYMKQL